MENKTVRQMDYGAASPTIPQRASGTPNNEDLAGLLACNPRSASLVEAHLRQWVAGESLLIGSSAPLGPQPGSR